MNDTGRWLAFAALAPEYKDSFCISRLQCIPFFGYHALIPMKKELAKKLTVPDILSVLTFTLGGQRPIWDTPSVQKIAAWTPKACKTKPTQGHQAIVLHTFGVQEEIFTLLAISGPQSSLNFLGNSWPVCGYRVAVGSALTPKQLLNPSVFLQNAQKHSPVSQNREYRQYSPDMMDPMLPILSSCGVLAHYLRHFGGPALLPSS